MQDTREDESKAEHRQRARFRRGVSLSRITCVRRFVWMVGEPGIEGGSQ